MVDGLIRRQRAEDSGQRSCRGFAAHFSQVRRMAVGGFCLLSSVFCPLHAEELPDPTRPPARFVAPAPGGEAVPDQPPGLQSVIISKTRRAAIINGETVELGGKYGDAKLIEVNEGNVVLRSAQGRQVMTLFPDVKIIAKRETKTGKQSPAGEAQAGKQKTRPAAQRGEK